MPNRITIVQVLLSLYLPLEDIVANYPPVADAPQQTVVIQPVKKYYLYLTE